VIHAQEPRHCCSCVAYNAELTSRENVLLGKRVTAEGKSYPDSCHGNRFFPRNSQWGSVKSKCNRGAHIHSSKSQYFHIQVSLRETSLSAKERHRAEQQSGGRLQLAVAGIATPGLQNQLGGYNCFLNCILQCLWNCRELRPMVLSWQPHQVQVCPLW